MPRRLSSWFFLAVFPVVLAFFAPQFAFAHAFGQQYTLPLPVSLYVLGGVCALVGSFAILGLFSVPRKGGSKKTASAANIVVTISLPRYTLIVLQALGLFVFFSTLFFGIFGSTDVYQNPVPTLFWILLLSGFAYLSAIVGGLWNTLNPFKTIAYWGLRDHRALVPYPKKLGVIPALVLFYFLIAIELFSGGAGANPVAIALGLSLYLVFTCLGSFIFGVRDWFRYSEFFSVFFGLIGKCAPVRVEAGNRETGERGTAKSSVEKETNVAQLSVTPPLERLVTEKAESVSVLIFILFMLSSTAYDGFHDTTPWIRLMYSVLNVGDFYVLTSFVIFLLSPFLFFALYALAIWLMKLFVELPLSLSKPAPLSASERFSMCELLLRFAYSLIPIAVVYNFAHYFTLLLSEGQMLIPFVSDPFSFGWNIFGTAGYQTNIGLIGADTIWQLQLGAIVVGHIAATYVAHRIALGMFKRRRDVIVGQLPMLALMVCYTIFGLWILSLPFSL